MQDLFSPPTRKVIYIIVVLVTSIVVPLNVGGVLPDLYASVWNSVAAAASLLAAFNTNK